MCPDRTRHQQTWPNIQIQPVAAPIRHLIDQLGEVDQVRDDLVDDRLPLERLAAPRGWKVPPLGEVGRRLLEPLGRPLRGGLFAEPAGGAPTQGTTDPVRRIGQCLLEPSVERLPEGALRLGQHVELRIHARLDRPLVQEVGTEPVDRADLRLFEVRTRVLDVPQTRGVVVIPAVAGTGQLVPGAFQPFTQP